MAKRDINSKGRVWLSIDKYRRRILNIESNKSDYDNRRNENKQAIPGVRVLILEEYKKSYNREDAYNKIEEINKNLGKEIYTQEIVDSWIDDYEKTRDDEHGNR